MRAHATDRGFTAIPETLFHYIIAAAISYRDDLHYSFEKEGEVLLLRGSADRKRGRPPSRRAWHEKTEIVSIRKGIGSLLDPAWRGSVPVRGQLAVFAEVWSLLPHQEHHSAFVAQPALPVVPDTVVDLVCPLRSIFKKIGP